MPFLTFVLLQTNPGSLENKRQSFYKTGRIEVIKCGSSGVRSTKRALEWQNLQDLVANRKLENIQVKSYRDLEWEVF